MGRGVQAVVVAFAAAACLSTPIGSTDRLALHAPTGFSNPVTRARIEAGAAVVDVLPAPGKDLGVFGVARTRIGGDRLVAWTRRIDLLQKGTYVPVAVRFSDPPRIEDLDSLVLGPSDLDDIRRCRLGDCGVKLDAHEIAQLRAVISRNGADWQRAVQEQFRQLMLDRAQTYLTGGFDNTGSSR